MFFFDLQWLVGRMRDDQVPAERIFFKLKQVSGRQIDRTSAICRLVAPCRSQV